MTVQEAEQLQLTAAKTVYGDLVEKGIASIQSIIWEGEFNTKDPSNPKFKAGYTYRASIKLMLDAQGPYILKYEMRNGDYYLDDTMVKIPVNGAPARVMISGPYFPSFSCVLTVPGGKGGNLKKESLYGDYNAHKKNYKRGASRDVEFVAFEVEPSEKDIQLAKERIDGLYEEFTKTSNLKTFLARNSDKPLNTYYYKEGELKSSFPQVEEFAFGKNPTVLPVVRKDNDFYAARVSDVKNLPDSVFVQHILLRSGSDNLADSLANVIRKGSDFSLLASEYSLDTNPNVENPGDLGWLTQTYMVPGMESVLSYNPGDVKVLNTNYGTHVVKVTKRTKPMKKVQVALLVIESVAGKETYQSYYAQANDLIIRSEGNITKFNEVAREGNLPIVPVSNVKEGASTLSKYKNTKEISRWIYEAKEGDVSPLFTVDNDKYFVVALKKVKEEGYTPIQEVSA